MTIHDSKGRLSKVLKKHNIKATVAIIDYGDNDSYFRISPKDAFKQSNIPPEIEGLVFEGHKIVTKKLSTGEVLNLQA